MLAGLSIYQIGSLFAGSGFGAGTVVGLAVIGALSYLLVRRGTDPDHMPVNRKSTVGAGV